MTSNQGVRPRHKMRAVVAYCGHELEGGGAVANISMSGALIEPSSTSAYPGERMGLTIFYWTEGQKMRSVDLSAEVVRTTPSGFAVRF